VSICHNEAHLIPHDRPDQTLLFNEISIDPEPDGPAGTATTSATT